MWKVATQQEIGVAVNLPGSGSGPGALTFSPGGKTFAMVDAERNRRAVERSHSEPDRRAHDGEDRGGGLVPLVSRRGAFSPDGRRWPPGP